MFSWRLPSYKKTIDRLGKIDTELTAITTTLRQLRKRAGQCPSAFAEELQSIVWRRDFLWSLYVEAFEEFYMQQGSHGKLAACIVNLRQRADRDGGAPRPNFEWIEFATPYADFPYIANALVRCTHCKRDGHIIVECGFKKAPTSVVHRNRYQRDNTSLAPPIHTTYHMDDTQRPPQNRNNQHRKNQLCRQRKQRDFRGEGWN
jgi:hypothetical protein